MRSTPLDLTSHKEAFNRVGWFIPPYLQLGFLTQIRDLINAGMTDQNALGELLALAYSPEHLAAMVTERYPVTPFISDYVGIIGEAVIAHFSLLGHASVLGLVPVVEGACRRIARDRNVRGKSVSDLFRQLAKDCQQQVESEAIGAVTELLAMFESFTNFTGEFLYVESLAYSVADKTNRHGMVHGAYADDDYGTPINFYKTVSAIDFLCLISSLRARLSFLAPNRTARSNKWSDYYKACSSLARLSRATTELEELRRCAEHPP